MEKYLDIWTARKLGVTRLTRKDIEAWQLEKIKETLDMAVASSPFFRKRYGSFTVENWEDFQKLPFTCPADVCE